METHKGRWEIEFLSPQGDTSVDLAAASLRPAAYDPHVCVGCSAISTPPTPRPLWVSNNSPPGPLSHERGGGKGTIQCIFHTCGGIHGGYTERISCHPRNAPVRGAGGLLLMTSYKLGLNRPEFINSPSGIRSLGVSNNSPLSRSLRLRSGSGLPVVERSRNHRKRAWPTRIATYLRP